MLAYKISACEVCIIWRKTTEALKSIANRRVEDWEASNGPTTDATRLFHHSWHDAVSEHIYVNPFRMCKRLRFHMFCRSHKYFKDAKAMQIRRILKIVKFDMSSSINPQNNRDLNQDILHPWSKFVDPSLKGWRVITRTSSQWGKFWLWS